MSQLALPLDWPEGESERDYIVSTSNAALVRHFERWSTWPVMATLLVGPRKSGRSLLARIVAARSGGEIADDAERADEEALFHAWNRAQERRRPLVLVAQHHPADWPVMLPDLRSRLAATPVQRVPPPDEALAARLIEKGCAARGLVVPAEVVRYVGPRIERSYLAVHCAVEALDAAAYERRQGLTVPLARLALGRAGIIDAAAPSG